MNILKIQDGLKNLSDDQLAQEMRLPSGSTPQYLIMTEMQRRQKMRDEFSGGQPPKTTMAEEMSGEAPPPPPAGGMPTEGNDANAQGLMGLPDDTMAGNAMRARIGGQPPQAMAAGGAVQFGSPFAGAQAAAPVSQSGGYAPVQQYAPKYYAPNTGADYSNIKNQFDPFHPPHGTPNPRVHMSDTDRYGIPKGMAAPTYGTPGLNRTFTGKDGQNTHYSWANDAARDAYIKSMTPEKKAGGGPIRMSGGGIFDDYYETTPEEAYATMRDSDITDMLGKKPEELNTTFGAFGGNPVTLTREGLLAEAKRRNQMNSLERGGKDLLRFAYPYIDTVTGLVAGAAKVPKVINEANAGLGQVMRNYAFGNVPLPEDAYGTSERGHGSGPSKPSDRIAPTGAVAPQKKAAPESASVSGNPKKEEKPASDGGLAALLAAQQDTGAKYKTEANSLLDQLRGDKQQMHDTDINNALIKFGLGLAGSKAQSLGAGISEAGLPALQEYTATREGRRKDERGLTADQLSILSKSEELSQADRKALQDAAVAQRDYELKAEANDINRIQAEGQNAYYRSRAAGVNNIYSKGQIDYAKKLLLDANDPVKRINITDAQLEEARQVLFESGGGGGGGGDGLPYDATYDPTTGKRTQ